jgi:hypothetical protein
MRHPGIIGAVSRRRLPWLVAIPLMVAGSLSAHELAYWVVTSNPGERAAALAETGHGYYRHLPLVLGLLAALALSALAARAAGRRAGKRSTSPWAFFALPPLAFAFQEHAERALAGAPWLTASLEPTFLVGLALQLPFALAALMAARALVSAAERLSLPRRAVAPALRPARTALVVPAAPELAPRRHALALGYAGRGPPLSAV